jgi:hypothetical protein
MDKTSIEPKKTGILSLELNLSKDNATALAQKSNYQPSKEEREAISRIIRDFTYGDLVMRKPRREFNDMSVLGRMTLDQMAFNTYQTNNGDPEEGDEINAWKSRAMRPVTRNKVISIAAHATARLIFPKVFAWNDANEEESDAAQVMEDLMEYAGDRADYPRFSMYAVLAALVNPASIVYEEYTDVYRTCKKDVDGKWVKEYELDDEQSGFRMQVVPVDQLYIENIYEHDIQKQRYLIWRRVVSYTDAASRYADMENWKYVKPGVQLIYNDANGTFYDVYDSSIRTDMVEEIIYWNKSEDLRLVSVNGVLISNSDEPNPRIDKRYPFAKFGYELIDAGKFFYYKSLAFKMQQDEKIINTLYPMVIDGTYLQLFPPMVKTGGEDIGSDVMIPGAVTNFADPNAQLRPIMSGANMTAGLNALFKAEQSISETAADSFVGSPANEVDGKGGQTAYGMSVVQQNANTILGLFVQMISGFVKDFGKIMLSDALQYLTIADATKLSDKGLVYKTFLLPNKDVGGKKKTKKIVFDGEMPEQMTGDEKLNMSYDLLQEQGGPDSSLCLVKANPTLIRNLKYMVVSNPDVLNPMSEELERRMGLEIYDRAIANPILDQEEVVKDFLLANYPRSKKDPEKYIAEQQEAPANPMDIMSMINGAGQQPQMGAKPNQPMQKMQNPVSPKSNIPQL